VFGLMKYNRTKNLRTDSQRRRGEGPACAAPCTAAPTSPPGGVYQYIRLWSMCELDGTLLRAGRACDFMGQHGPSSAVPEDLHQGPHGSLPRTRRLTCYAIGTTASADPRWIFHWPIIGTGPQARSSAIDPPGAATLRWSGPEQRLGARRTRKRTTAGGPSGALDTSCYPVKGWENASIRELYSRHCSGRLENVDDIQIKRQLPGHSLNPTLQSLQGGIKRTAIPIAESDVYLLWSVFIIP
jgi:hypothetical protein